MSTWFRETPESLRFLAEERALIEATELIADCMDERGVNRSTLADRLGVGRSEITQRLSGKRNLSVKTLGAMLHELGYRIRIDAEDVESGARRTSRPIVVTGRSPFAVSSTKYTSSGNPLSVVRVAA